jgi:hypothetical protein
MHAALSRRRYRIVTGRGYAGPPNKEKAMTTEEVHAVELLEQRHALYDLDEDSVRGEFTYGPAADAGPHIIGCITLRES